MLAERQRDESFCRGAWVNRRDRLRANDLRRITQSGVELPKFVNPGKVGSSAVPRPPNALLAATCAPIPLANHVQLETELREHEVQIVNVDVAIPIQVAVGLGRIGKTTVVVEDLSVRVVDLPIGFGIPARIRGPRGDDGNRRPC